MTRDAFVFDRRVDEVDPYFSCEKDEAAGKKPGHWGRNTVTYHEGVGGATKDTDYGSTKFRVAVEATPEEIAEMEKAANEANEPVKPLSAGRRNHNANQNSNRRRPFGRHALGAPPPPIGPTGAGPTIMASRTKRAGSPPGRRRAPSNSGRPNWAPATPPWRSGPARSISWEGTAKQDTVLCLNADTGATVWKHSYPAGESAYGGGPRATPAVDGKAVYTVSADGQVFCLDAVSGQVIWSKNLQKELNLAMPLPQFRHGPRPRRGTVAVEHGSVGAGLGQEDRQRCLEERGRFELLLAGAVSPLQGNVAWPCSPPANWPLWIWPTGRKIASYEWKTRDNANCADPVIVGRRDLHQLGLWRRMRLDRCQRRQPRSPVEERRSSATTPLPCWRATTSTCLPDRVG